MRANFDDDSLTFDAALTKLEGLADHLEKGDIPLEKALEVYEEAVRLFALCRGRLDGVEQRIEQLSEALDGTLRAEPVDANEADCEDD